MREGRLVGVPAVERVEEPQLHELAPEVRLALAAGAYTFTVEAN